MNTTLMYGMSAAALLLGLPSAALAQQPASEASPPPSNALDEIVVTAQRKAEALQDVPIAVSAFQGQALADRGAVDLSQVALATPGLTFQTFNRSVPLVYLRGVGTRSFGAGSENSVGVFIDDIYVSRVSGALLELADVERVEVLKGPQGTLYGRNTIAGAINVITRDPTRTPDAYARLTVGSYDLIQAEGAVSGALIDDKLLARLSFFTLDQTGYTRNLTTGGRLNGNDTSAVRLKLRALASETLTVDLNGSYTRDRTSGYAGNPLGPSVIFASASAPIPRTTADRYSNYFSFDPTTSRDIGQTSARVQWDGAGVAVTAITGYRDARVKEHQDNDQTELDSFEQFTREHSRSFTQELRLSSANESDLEWIAGLFYQRDLTDRDDTFVTGRDSIFSSLQTSMIDSGIPNVAARGRIRSRYPVALDARTRSIAAFGQATYNLTDRLNVTLGLRYTRDRKTADYDVGSDALPGLGLVAQPFALALSRSWTSWDPKLVVDYKLTDRVLVYASYAEGFKSGGFQFGTATPQGTSIVFDPEKVSSYEVGLKSTLFDGSVRFNAAAFHYDYQNLQVPRVLQAPGGRIDNITTNAAESTIRGLEFELTAKLSSRVEVGLQYAFLDARYDEYVFIPGVQDFSGNRMVRAPKHTLSGSAEYRVPVGGHELGVRGDFFYSSKVFFEPDEGATPNTAQGDYLTVNGALFYETGRWRVTAWAKNITDETHRATVLRFPVQVTEFVAPPRTFGMTLGWRY